MGGTECSGGGEMETTVLEQQFFKNQIKEIIMIITSFSALCYASEILK